MNIDPSLSQRLAQVGQDHLLRFWNKLDENQRAKLHSQLNAIDFDLINRLYRGEEKAVDWEDLARRAVPPKAVRLEDVKADRVVLDGKRCSRAEAIGLGERAIRSGKLE